MPAPEAVSPPSILIAEDNEYIRRLLVAALERQGHQAKATENGHEALLYLREHSQELRLLITDHEMPMLNGLGLVRQLRKLRAELPVLVISAQINASLRLDYEAAGVKRILAKPHSIKELEEAVNSLIYIPD